MKEKGNLKSKLIVDPLDVWWYLNYKSGEGKDEVYYPFYKFKLCEPIRV